MLIRLSQVLAILYPPTELLEDQAAVLEIV